MGSRTRTLQDWLGRPYEVEIAFVRFVGGYVVWIDDEPWDDNVFPTSRRACLAVKRYLRG